MAGAGYKDFTAGAVLTAAQLNQYCNEQSVMVFATTAARDSALTSVLAEGMTCYVKDGGSGTPVMFIYDGSAWGQLPVNLKIQRGFESTNTDASGQIAITFGTAVTAGNSSLHVTPFSTGTTLRMVQVAASNASGFTVTCFNGTSRVISGNAQFFWSMTEWDD